VRPSPCSADTIPGGNIAHAQSDGHTGLGRVGAWALQQLCSVQREPGHTLDSGRGDLMDSLHAPGFFQAPRQQQHNQWISHVVCHGNGLLNAASQCSWQVGRLRGIKRHARCVLVGGLLSGAAF
jgi:hypothetical protein